ncbi:MAG TPA: hypothetical protein VGZ47_07785 [Gemmataceae bacterium]|nr:hypothetical protein [Gemmataceae bacterium]
MDWIDVIFRGWIVIAVGVPVLAVAAIGLRVACHFAGAEIPALGRAFGTALLTWGMTLALGLIMQSFAIGFADARSSIALQFLVFVLTLVGSLVLSAALYVRLLSVRFGQALTIWVIQIVFVAGVGLLFGCLAGIVSAIFD